MNTEREHNKQLSDLGYSIKSKLIRDHEFNSDRMADWQIELTGPNGKAITTEYHTGKGHRIMSGNRKLLFRACLADWQCSKAASPDLASVLSSLVLDSSAGDQSFDEWCGDYGYDTDSRKALDTYLACQGSGTKLRSIGANIYELQDVLQDY